MAQFTGKAKRSGVAPVPEVEVEVEVEVEGAIGMEALR
jgi:hypothetical protein